MANEPPTGVLFHSKLDLSTMRLRLKEKMPEFDWRQGNSDSYPFDYLRAKRPDGLKVRIEPEDEPGDFYLGVYFRNMKVSLQPEEQLALAHQIHKQVLPIVEGQRKA